MFEVFRRKKITVRYLSKYRIETMKFMEFMEITFRASSARVKLTYYTQKKMKRLIVSQDPRGLNILKRFLNYELIDG